MGISQSQSQLTVPNKKPKKSLKFWISMGCLSLIGIVSVLIVVAYIFMLFFPIPEEKPAGTKSTQISEEEKQAQISEAQKQAEEEAAKKAEEEKRKQDEDKARIEAEKINLSVENTMVKMVSGKCRYFFTIKNVDTKEFNGSVSIQPINKDGSKIGGEGFKTSQPMQPKGGTSIYMDMNTCPVALHGDFGISTYTYEVRVNNDIVGTGSGKITDKFEDIDAYGF